MYVIGDVASFPLQRRGGDLQNVQHVQHARCASRRLDINLEPESM